METLDKDILKFTFFKNYYDIIKYLPSKDRLIMYDAIMQYMFEEKEPELKALLSGIWVNIKMPLDTNKKNIKNGQNGGRPISKNKTQAKPKHNPDDNPNITQTKPNKEPKAKANNISYFLFLISNNKYKYILENSNIYIKVKEWLEYKQERKEIYKETGLKSLLTEIENQIDTYGEEKVIDLITQCMASNYRGIIFDKLKKTTYMTQREKDREFVEKMRKELENEQETSS